MSDKMTSGEIAKQAGISQKAVRLYDQKGLLKPSGYSEGNYRLYDKEALLILEKIIALKQVGFSLEEIRDSLYSDGEQDIESVLREQVRMMEGKKYQLEKSIQAINRTLERNTGKLNWDDVAEIIRMIGKDQRADERCWDAKRHTDQELEWYVRIFRSLGIREKDNVLDLGCGYADLWRQNWTDIPAGTQIFGYDLHGSWADDFVNYLAEHQEELPEDVRITVSFMDMETEEAWEQIRTQEPYELVIAHYVDNVLHDRKRLFARINEVLSDTGMFSYNGGYVSDWHIWLKGVFEELELEGSFPDELIARQTVKRDELHAVLKQSFGRVEPVMLPNTWHYQEADDLFEKLLTIYPQQEKELRKQEKRLKEYFATRIEEDGELVIPIRSQFWHCYKKS